MKIYLSILLLGLISCSMNIANLIEGQWMIKDVKYLNNGKVLDEKFNEGYYFKFNSDKSFEGFSINKFDGNWKLNQDTLIVIMNDGMNKFYVKHISKDSLTMIALDKELEFKCYRKK